VPETVAVELSEKSSQGPSKDVKELDTDNVDKATTEVGVSKREVNEVQSFSQLQRKKKKAYHTPRSRKGPCGLAEDLYRRNKK
jgi:hypothetical protein